MVIKARQHFTPEVLLSAPRRSAGIPSPDGRHILYSETAYSFEKQVQSSEIRVIDVETEESSLVTGDTKCSNPCWLKDDTIALLRSTDAAATELVLGPLTAFEKKSYVAGHVCGPASNLKVVHVSEDFWGIAVTASANPDGTIYHPKQGSKPRSTGRLYRSTFVRHWDKWVTPQRNAIFYGSLLRGTPHEEKLGKTYSLSTMTNALKHTSLESPIAPFGGSDHFDISRSGIVFVAKDPDLNQALNTKCNLYLVPLTNFRETTPTLYTTKLEHLDGAFTSPVFSRDGSKVAWLAMAENGYESDRNQIVIMPDVTRPAWVIYADNPTDRRAPSPQSLIWSADGTTLYLTAEGNATRGLYAIRVTSMLNDILGDEKMHILYEEDSVDDIQLFANHERPSTNTHDKLFLSSSSLVSSRIFSIMDVKLHRYADSSTSPIVSTISRTAYGGHSQLGLSSSQVSRLYSPAANPSFGVREVESLVITPPNFDSSKKYPLALLIHGGPQGAWLDAWSTRWNPCVFASQGYVVVCPNITGSTGYGQDFVDGIKENWGGTPYDDLVNLFDHLKTSVPYVDTDRAVALGASYGGFMMNWIQGHDLGRKFKALVTHDGVFSSYYEAATDELYFINHDFGGYISDGPEARKRHERWDPSRFTENWSTPHLIIHSEKDYRLTMADGLAAFNTLQIRGVESELLTFPDENHFVLNPENSLVWHTTVFNWINPRVGLPAYKPQYGDVNEVIQDPPMMVMPKGTPCVHNKSRKVLGDGTQQCAACDAFDRKIQRREAVESYAEQSEASGPTPEDRWKAKAEEARWEAEFGSLWEKWPSQGK